MAPQLAWARRRPLKTAPAIKQPLLHELLLAGWGSICLSSFRAHMKSQGLQIFPWPCQHFRNTAQWQPSNACAVRRCFIDSLIKGLCCIINSTPRAGVPLHLGKVDLKGKGERQQTETEVLQRRKNTGLGEAECSKRRKLSKMLGPHSLGELSPIEDVAGSLGSHCFHAICKVTILNVLTARSYSFAALKPPTCQLIEPPGGFRLAGCTRHGQGSGEGRVSYTEEAKSIVQQSLGSERRGGWMGEEWMDINWSQTGSVSMGGDATVEENHHMEGGAPTTITSSSTNRPGPRPQQKVFVENIK